FSDKGGQLKRGKKTKRYTNEHPIALLPVQTTPRIIAQRGMFTVHGTRTEPLDEVISDHLVEIVIDDRAVETFMKYVAVMGGSAFALFPEIDQLCQHNLTLS